MSAAGRHRRHRVHRRRPRPRGARRRRDGRRRRRLDARALARRRRAPRRRARLRQRRGARRGRRRRRRPRLHAQPPARGPRRAARSSAGKHVDLREAARHRRRRRAAPRRPRRGGAALRRGPVRLPLLPHRPRGAPPRSPRARAAPSTSIHGTYLQDWLLSPEDDNWRVDAELGGASRAFADIGSHWCDLAEFVTGHRITRLSARTTTAVPERRHGEHREAFARGDGDGARRARSRPRTPSSLQFETDGGALGSAVISQISAGPQEPAVARGRRRRARRSPSTRRTPSRCGSAAATSRRSSGATPPRCRPPAARLAVAARRPPAGLPGLLQPLRRRRLRGDRDGDGARRAARLRRRPARRAASPTPCSPRPARSAGSTSPARRCRA